MMRYSAIGFFCGIVVLSGVAHADDLLAVVFPKGTLSFTTEVDYAHNFDISPARLEGGGIGFGYYIFDNFSVNLDLTGLTVQQPVDGSDLAGADTKIRHHLLSYGPLSFFIDFGGGITYASVRTPATGTFLNFTVQSGPGLTYQIQPNVYLMGGIRYWHLSNARLEGPMRNPSINTWDTYVGLMWTF